MTPAVFNLWEAILWFMMGSGFLLAAGFKTSAIPYRPIMVRVSIWFLLFGCSDLIEIQTGAWWRPLGLLVLKAACIAGLLEGLISYQKSKRSG